MTKAGTSTLKSFYSQTTISFLEQWPHAPTAKMLEDAENDTAKACQGHSTLDAPSELKTHKSS